MKASNKFKVFIRTYHDGSVPTETEKYRMRIIYPDGSAEWSDARYMFDKSWYNDGFITLDPCWYKKGMTEKEAIKMMKLYDKFCGYKTELLFEMK